jgi:hypothetical protein
MITTMRIALRDERGVETVQWIGLSAVILTLIMAIWLAVSGGAGQALKATIGDVAAHYANGFEGGLSTSGPTGGMPAMSSIDPATFSPQARPPTHFGTIPGQSPWPITTLMLGIPLLLE